MDRESSTGKANRIELFRFDTPQMRAFHMSWLAFFLCFFAWFGIAPLMKVVRDELHLTPQQVGWCIVASVTATIFARLLIGWLCDRWGPRLTYSLLLVLGSIPVMGIGLSHDFTTFLIARLLIGAIGAAFVITQYHTTLMFAPNCIGTANATTAGWGNLGGGVTQVAMPLIYSLLVAGLGLSAALGWRFSMVIAGVVCLLTGIAYWRFTQDTPEGNFRELRATGRLPQPKNVPGGFGIACRDSRVWALAILYACCFGIELTIKNIAALYYVDYFEYFNNMDSVQAMKIAGIFAAMYGGMNLFARTLGGLVSDRLSGRFGLHGRVTWLFVAIFCEGLLLVVFSRMTSLGSAVLTMLFFAMFVQMSCGATYAVVPFINRRALGSITGLVGAGGNVGAVAAGFLFQGAVAWPDALLILGVVVTFSSFAALAVRFTPEAEAEARSDLARLMAASGEGYAEPTPSPAAST